MCTRAGLNSPPQHDPVSTEPGVARRDLNPISLLFLGPSHR